MKMFAGTISRCDAREERYELDTGQQKQPRQSTERKQSRKCKGCGTIESDMHVSGILGGEGQKKLGRDND